MSGKPIKVLLIEDSVFAIRHTKKMLAKSKDSQIDVQLECAEKLSVGLDRLTRGGIDIVLLDLVLPDSSDLDTFTAVHAQVPEMPIIVLTGFEDEKLAIEAVHKGAQDYLVKGQLNNTLLKRSIMYAIERKRSEEKLKASEQQLRASNQQLDASNQQLIFGKQQLESEIVERKKLELRNNVLNQLQKELLEPGSLNSKMNLITDALVTMVGADFVRIWLIDKGDQCENCSHSDAADEQDRCKYRDKCLHLVASSGRYTHIDGDHARVPFGCYKIGLIASGKNDQFLTNHVTTDPRVHNNQWAAELGLVSFAGYKLCDANGESIGVMALFADYEMDIMMDAFLSGISHTVSQVIIGKRAEKNLKKTLAEVEQFNRLMTGREMRVVEMKKEINALQAELGRQPGYQSVREDEKVELSSEKSKEQA